MLNATSAGFTYEMVGTDAAMQTQLLDLGNPEARAWLVERMSSLIESEGVDVYRQDFNFAPLDFWRT